ncbi:MAG: 16S rRNA (uracil(1498)-N(3))-methyltransferase [Propionibacteriaceae bacterium]|nr:16S rRNA (uracil(1498)-N(3))-methyltransferase [Propionibacteriaceae bacterium]
MSDGFFLAVLPAGVSVGAAVALTGGEARHAAVVRRIRVGEVVTVADGSGQGVRGPALAVAPDRVVIEVAELLTAEPPAPFVTVVQALPKKDRGPLAVDLMTELGVDAVVPWQAARSTVRWEGERGEKARAGWQAAAREAAKQSRRLTVPVVDEVATTRQVAELLKTAGQRAVFHEAAKTPLGSLAVDPAKPLVCVIGPEGGLTPAELDAFLAVGAQAYCLGPTVLRTSTAGAAALAQLRLLAAQTAARLKEAS